MVISKKKYALIIVAVLFALLLIARNGENKTTQNPAIANAAQTRVMGECKKHPVEIFPVSEKLESNDLVKLTDTNCPNARHFPDEHFEVVYQGRVFAVQTKKLNFEGPAFYEIVSIKGR